MNAPFFVCLQALQFNAMQMPLGNSFLQVVLVAQIFGSSSSEHAVNINKAASIGNIKKDRVFNFHERFSSMSDFNRSINIGLKMIGKELGIDSLQFYAARHSMATIAANEAGIDRWTVNLMLNHTDQSMCVTELYIKRDFAPINEANFRLMEYVFGI